MSQEVHIEDDLWFKDDIPISKTPMAEDIKYMINPLPFANVNINMVKKELKAKILDLNIKVNCLNNNFDNAITSIKLGVAISII